MKKKQTHSDLNWIHKFIATSLQTFFSFIPKQDRVKGFYSNKMQSVNVKIHSPESLGDSRIASAKSSRKRVSAGATDSSSVPIYS